MRRLGLLLVPLIASGCFLDRSTLAPDGGSPQLIDGGPLPDAGQPVDAGSPEDAGQREDTGTPMLDAGPSCAVEDERCEGGLLFRCVDDRLTAEMCTEECWLDPGSGPRCVACIPGVGQCVADGTAAEVCMDDASGWSARTDCPRGCDSGACRPETMCNEAVDLTLAPGDPVVRLDLCRAGERTYELSGNCGMAHATTTDRLVRLEIPRAGTYTIRAADDDNTALIAPVLYVREACEMMTPQLGCDESWGEDQPREVALELSLDAGDYFLIVDAIRNGQWQCGHVEVSVTAAGR